MRRRRHESRQDLQEFQGQTDAKLDQVQRVVRSAIEPLEVRQHEIESRLSAQEMAINEMRQQLANMRYTQKGTEAVATEVKKEMAVAADSVSPPRPQQPGWSREGGEGHVRRGGARQSTC